MLTFVVRRLAYSVPVLIVASFLVFVATRAAFDPTAQLAQVRDPAAKTRFIEKYGLDQPVAVQWWKWLTGILRGDFGTSIRTGGDIWPDVSRALGVTIQLIVWGLLFAVLFAVTIGVYSAVRQYSAVDYASTSISYLLLAVPPAAFALIAIQFFVFQLTSWLNLDRSFFFFVGFHSTGKSGFNLDYLQHLFLPVLTLTVQLIAGWSRFMRASMLDVLSSDYVRTARAKGVPRRKVILRHAFRNAVTPVLTVMAVDAGALFGGLVVTEFVFSLTGMGQLLITALLRSDAYTVMAWMLVAGVFVILFNLLADVLYAVLDPRVRLS